MSLRPPEAAGDPAAGRGAARQSWPGSSGNTGCLGAGRAGPAAYSLAAVGVEDSTEEFHAHDGEGVVKDEQGEAQAGEEGQKGQGDWGPGRRARRLRQPQHPQTHCAD